MLPAPSASSMPCMTGMLNRPKLSLVSRPTVNVRPRIRLRARWLGRKPSCWAAAWTRSRVSSRSWPRPLSAFDAVPTDTPASRATSWMVTRNGKGFPMVRSVPAAPGRCQDFDSLRRATLEVDGRPGPAHAPQKARKTVAGRREVMRVMRGALRRLVPAAIALCAVLSGPAQLAEAAVVGLPALPVNSCNNSSLPKSFGTNFPVPADPFGFGFADQSIMGWEGNTSAPIAYLSGSFFARGVPVTFTAGGSSFCGAMYSFGAYTFGLASGQAPAPGSVQWAMASGFLPALTTSFTRNNVRISIQNFADQVTIGSGAFELLYSRVSLTNNGSAAVTIDPAPTGPNRATLANPSNTLQAGQSANHDYVVAVDNFGSGQALPSAATLQSSAPSFDTAFSQMSTHWNGLLAVTPEFTLPNLTLPNTNNLANPGTAMSNAYKATFVYTRIIQVSKAPFSGANNYDWLLNHDVPGILVNRFAQGDFTDAQNLLLVGRISEQPGFNDQGANWYFDVIWKRPVAWAVYLEHTNDTAFVSQFFNDTQTQWGPSLFNMFHN